jgi:gliding motility-associated-like protein
MHPVTVVQPPTAAISYPTAAMCSTAGLQAVNLTGTHAYLGGTFESTPGLVINPLTGTINPLTSVPGPYTVKYIVPTTDNCTIDPATVNITIATQPTAAISYGVPDYCTSVTTTVPLTITGTGAYTGGVFTATPAGLNLNSANGYVNPSLSVGGLYTITYTVPAGGGCAAVPVTTTLTINTKPTAVFTYGGTPYCDTHSTAEIPTMSGTGAYTGGVFSATPSTLIINPTTGAITPSANIPGSYTVTYLIPAGGGCPGLPVTTTIKITELPTAVISYAGPYCHSVTASQPVIRTGTAAFTGGTYTSTPGLVIDAVSGAIKPSASVPDTYTVIYTIPATSGCVAIPVQTTVTIHPLPEPALEDAVICSDSDGVVYRNALLDSGLPDNGYDFEWLLASTVITGATGNTYTATAPGTYSLIVTNSQTGCSAAPVYATVEEAESVEDFVASITETFTENNTLTVLISGGTGPYLYQLDGEGFVTTNTFHDLSAGTHIISITDVNGCTDVTKELIVFGFPKYFTPNGDGANDFWNIFYLNQQDAGIYIYDRYGKLLKQLGPSGKGWDGTFNGNMMPAADYWFVVNYKETDKTGLQVPRQFKAHFSLKR